MKVLKVVLGYVQAIHLKKKLFASVNTYIYFKGLYCVIVCLYFKLQIRLFITTSKYSYLLC